MTEIAALCWTAHGGKGALFIAVADDDAKAFGLHRKPSFQRRHASSLPGARKDGEQGQGNSYYWVGEYSAVTGPINYWSSVHGPDGFRADEGFPTWFCLELPA